MNVRVPNRTPSHQLECMDINLRVMDECKVNIFNQMTNLSARICASLVQ